MDMDVDDIDLCLDPINGFLSHKLDEVKNLKDEMKQTVRDLEGFIEHPIKAKLRQCETFLVHHCWTRIFNGKYVIGIAVRNKHSSDITKMHCILQWTSIMHSQFKTRIYSPEENSFVDVLKKHRGYTILLVVNQFDFSRYLEYHAKLIILYENDGKQYQVIRAVSVSVDDFSKSSEILVNGSDLLFGKTSSVLTAMSSQNHLALVAKLMGNSSRDLENHLRLDCMLRVSGFENYIPDKLTTFVFDRISEAIDETILQCTKNDGIYCIDIFYRDKFSLQHILHHLHKNIKQLYLLPRRYENDLRKLKFDNNFGTQMFVSQMLEEIDTFQGGLLKQGLIDQIEIIKDFQVNVLECDGVSESNDVTAEFSHVRNLLTPNELKCDLAFEKIEN